MTEGLFLYFALGFLAGIASTVGIVRWIEKSRSERESKPEGKEPYPGAPMMVGADGELYWVPKGYDEPWTTDASLGVMKGAAKVRSEFDARKVMAKQRTKKARR